MFQFLFCQPQVKTTVTKPQAASSPLASEEDERASNRTIGTGKITHYSYDVIANFNHIAV